MLLITIGESIYFPIMVPGVYSDKILTVPNIQCNKGVLFIPNPGHALHQEAFKEYISILNGEDFNSHFKPDGFFGSKNLKDIAGYAISSDGRVDVLCKFLKNGSISPLKIRQLPYRENAVICENDWLSLYLGSMILACYTLEETLGNDNVEDNHIASVLLKVYNEHCAAEIPALIKIDKNNVAKMVENFGELEVENIVKAEGCLIRPNEKLKSYQAILLDRINKEKKAEESNNVTKKTKKVVVAAPVTDDEVTETKKTTKRGRKVKNE